MLFAADESKMLIKGKNLNKQAESSTEWQYEVWDLKSMKKREPHKAQNQRVGRANGKVTVYFERDESLYNVDYLCNVDNEHFEFGNLNKKDIEN